MSTFRTACTLSFRLALASFVCLSMSGLALGQDFRTWSKERRAFLEKDTFFSKLTRPSFVEAEPFLLHVSGGPAVAQVIQEEILPLLQDQLAHFETTIAKPGRLNRRPGYEGFTVSVVESRQDFERYFANRPLEQRADGKVAKYDHRQRVLMICVDPKGTQLTPDAQQWQSLFESGTALLDAFSPGGLLAVIAYWEKIGIADHLAQCEKIQVLGKTRHRFGDIAPGRLDDFLLALEDGKMPIPLEELLKILDEWALQAACDQAAAKAVALQTRTGNARAAMRRFSPAAFHLLTAYLLDGSHEHSKRYVAGASEMLSADYHRDRLFELLKTDAENLEFDFVTWVLARPGVAASRARLAKIQPAPRPVATATNTKADPFTALRNRKKEAEEGVPEKSAGPPLTPAERLAQAVRKAMAGDTPGFIAGATTLGPQHARLAERVKQFQDRFFRAVADESTLLTVTLPSGEEVKGTVTTFQNGELLLDLRTGGQRKIAAGELSWDELVVLARSRLRWKEGSDYIDYAAVLLALGDPKEARKMRATASRKDEGDSAVLDAVWEDFARAAAAVRLEDRITAAGPGSIISVFEAGKDDELYEEVFTEFVDRYRPALETAYAEIFDPTSVVAPMLKGKVESGSRPGTVKILYDFSSADQVEDWPGDEPKALRDFWQIRFEDRDVVHGFELRDGGLVAGRLGYVRHVLRLAGPATLRWRCTSDVFEDTTEDYYVNAQCGSLCDDGELRNMYSLADGMVIEVKKGAWARKGGRRIGEVIRTQYIYELEWTGEKLIGSRDGKKLAELPASSLTGGYASFFFYADLSFRLDDVIIEGRPDPKLIERPRSLWVAEQIARLKTKG
ncbi:MAG: hypothetical protein RL885_02350 [Planctomycetota bacterium]